MYRTYLAILGNKSVSVYEMNFKSHKTNCVFSCLICEYLWQCFPPQLEKHVFVWIIPCACSTSGDYTAHQVHTS